MRYELKMILASILMAFMARQAYGNTPADSVKVYFHVSYSQFDPATEDNRKAMESFISIMGKKQMANEIDSVVIRASTSPEGASVSNEKLSRLRCDNLADFILQEAGIDPLIIRKVPEGVAWDELRRIVAGHPKVPSREKILDILDNVPLWIRSNSTGAIVDGKKKRLMELDSGETFRWLSDSVFPQLRNASAMAFYSSPKEPDSAYLPDLSETSETDEYYKTDEYSETPETPEDADLSEPSDTLPALPAKKELIRFNMAVRTNTLYDALLVTNIGVEFCLDRHISVYGEWMYAWWNNDRRHRFWRIYGGDLGLRWWFGRKANPKPLTGHHLGIYGGILTFDFETGDTGYLGGKPGGTLWDRWIVNSGVEYGYSVSVGKRLNIDFSIGIGYMGGHYIKYYPFDNDYYFDKEYNMHYLGPTKAEISLVWLIGRHTSNHRKGGEE